MLTLPEFMREPLPLSERNKDSALLTLPEFVREAVPPHLLHPDPEVKTDSEDVQTGKGKEKKRHRSLSAPPLAWLRSISSSSNLSTSSTSSSKSKPKVSRAHGKIQYSKSVRSIAQCVRRIRHHLRRRKSRESPSHPSYFSPSPVSRPVPFSTLKCCPIFLKGLPTAV